MEGTLTSTRRALLRRFSFPRPSRTMRIVAGILRGRPLKAPRGDETRPTTDRTREAIFSLVAARMELGGALVLDLFAGSGALGLEAVSRGAAACTFVEAHPGALRVARENARALGVEEACSFVKSDAVAFATRFAGPRFDLILADPPYDLPALPHLPDRLTPLLSPEGLLVLEHDSRHDFSAHPACLVARRYGQTVVSIFGETPG